MDTKKQINQTKKYCKDCKKGLKEGINTTDISSAWCDRCYYID